MDGINIDKTAPTITGSPDRLANSFGWYNADVTVSFVGADGLSGVDTVSGPTILGEGADQSVVGTVTDLAGNSATFTVDGINIDKTAPTITLTPDSDTYLPGTSFAWVVADQIALSGVDTAAVKIDGNTVSVVEAGSMLMLPGAHTVEVSGQDKAGNAAIPVARTYTTYGVAKVGNEIVVVGTEERDIIYVHEHDSKIRVDLRLGTQWHDHDDDDDADEADDVHENDSVHQHLLFDAVDVNSISIYTFGGNDRVKVGHSITVPARIDGGTGDDYLRSGSGNDTIVDPSGNNKIWGGAGNDTITTGDGNDRVWTDGGNDVIHAGDGDNEVHSGDGNDLVTTGSGRDVIEAGAGDDEVHAGAGNDSVDGGTGHDVIWGEAGNDNITGGSGNDVLIGGLGADRIVGSAGNDILIAGELTGTFNDNSNSLGASLNGHVYDFALLRALSTWWSSNKAADSGLDTSGSDTDVVDEALDQLTGSSGADWFIIGNSDKITDLSKCSTKGADGDVVTKLS